MVGIRSFPFSDGLFSGALAFSFREGNTGKLQSQPQKKNTQVIFWKSPLKWKPRKFRAAFFHFYQCGCFSHFPPNTTHTTVQLLSNSARSRFKCCSCRSAWALSRSWLSWEKTHPGEKLYTTFSIYRFWNHIFIWTALWAPWWCREMSFAQMHLDYPWLWHDWTLKLIPKVAMLERK